MGSCFLLLEVAQTTFTETINCFQISDAQKRPEKIAAMKTLTIAFPLNIGFSDAGPVY